jgi:stage IV sporulation protein A
VPGYTDLSTGETKIKVELNRDCYYSIISQKTGLNIENDAQLLQILSDLAHDASEYKRVAPALRDVAEKGYGIVMPKWMSFILKTPR